MLAPPALGMRQQSSFPISMGGSYILNNPLTEIDIRLALNVLALQAWLTGCLFINKMDVAKRNIKYPPNLRYGLCSIYL